MESNPQATLEKLVQRYEQRFSVKPQFLGEPIEAQIAMLEKALETGEPITAEMVFNTFSSLDPLPPKGMERMDADSETRGFQRHVQMANLKGKPRS